MIARRMALLLVIAVVAVLTASPVFGAGGDKLVVFVEVDDPVTKKKLKDRPDVSKRHEFPNGFSATIPAKSRKGIESRPGVTVHDVPVYQLTTVPSDQTPYGIEQIYNDPTITSTSGGAGVVIGHLDTGVNKDHPDLKNRIVGCKDATGRGIRKGCKDGNGHGTHTLGTAVADGGDGTGIFGVAPDAMAYVVKVCKAGCWTDDIAAAIDFLGDKVQIITMSIGGDTESGLIRDAINRNLHLLYVAAAGNDGPDAGSIDYPGANPNVIAVAAIDSPETVASFSSRGIDDGKDAVISAKEVELAAAGVGVESTWNDGGYNTISGTSMATPHIAGLAAREWQGSAAATRSYLRTYVEDITLANGGGAGIGYDIASGYGLGHVTPATTVASGTIAGTVTESNGTTAISAATVSVEGTTLSATTNANGDYSIVNVPEGTHDVTASADGFVSETKTGISVTADTPTPVDFALVATPTGTIAGKVTESNGTTAISAATVAVEGTTLSATTDGNGDYSIGNVPEGTHDVTASADGFVSDTRTGIAVTADSTTPVDFALAVVTTATTVSVDSITYATEGGKRGDKHLLITVALVDDLGNLVGGASVSIDLYRDGSRIASGTGTTGANGTLTFSLKNAKSGTHTTTVTNVTAASLTWDGVTPANEFVK